MIMGRRSREIADEWDRVGAIRADELREQLAEVRAQLAAAEQRLARWADAIEGHVLAALLERGEQGDGELWDDVQAYRREQTDEGKNDESR